VVGRYLYSHADSLDQGSLFLDFVALAKSQPCSAITPAAMRMQAGSSSDCGWQVFWDVGNGELSVAWSLRIESVAARDST